MTTTAVTTPRLPRRGLSDRAVRNLCILPVLALLIAFNVFPLLASVFITFTDYTPITDHPPKFIGTDNYRAILADPQQEPWHAFSRTAALVLITVSLQTLLGFGSALLLHRRFFGRGAIVALLLIPMMLSPAVIAAFWKYMLFPDYGGINWLLGQHVPWTGDSPRAFWAVVIVEVWMWTPFMMLLSLAGLNSVPESLYEAAEVDRASAWFRFRNITLPLVAPLLALGMIFRFMDTFRLFDTANVLNDALPGRPTTFISVLLYTYGFRDISAPLGKGVALAYLLLVVAVAIGNLAVRYLDSMRSRQT